VAEGTRLLSEYGGQTPSRVRIPPSPFLPEAEPFGASQSQEARRPTRALPLDRVGPTLGRLYQREVDRDEPTDLATRDAQLAAITAWGIPDPELFADEVHDAFLET
jgi:hypothetical protein